MIMPSKLPHQLLQRLVFFAKLTCRLIADQSARCLPIATQNYEFCPTFNANILACRAPNCMILLAKHKIFLYYPIKNLNPQSLSTHHPLDPVILQPSTVCCNDQPFSQIIDLKERLLLNEIINN